MKKIQDNRINPIFAVLVAYMLGYFLVNDLNLRYIYVYLLLGVMLLIGIFMDGVIRPRMKIRDILFEIKQRLSPMKLCFLFLSAVIAHRHTQSVAVQFPHGVFSLTNTNRAAVPLSISVHTLLTSHFI